MRLGRYRIDTYEPLKEGREGRVESVEDLIVEQERNQRGSEVWGDTRVYTI
jgi:hypothetical protein